jgi:pSer/pThr/pTyr-binding forkhead associated (FHA) protein
MAKLVLSTGGTVVFQYFLDDERLGIGRRALNQVVIDDPAVSLAHAVIVPVGNDHILEDLGSANGTFVNGTRIERHILQHGDVIEFGKYNLRYMNPRASAETDLDRTMLFSGLQAPVAQGPDDPRPSAESLRIPTARPTRTRTPKARVTITAGPRARSTVELDRVVTMFGKPGVRMAVVTRRPHGFFITHVEGDRFPRVNGRRIDAEPRQLRGGDEFEVGDERVEFKQD